MPVAISRNASRRREVGKAFPTIDSAAVQVALAVFEPAEPHRARGGL